MIIKKVSIDLPGLKKCADYASIKQELDIVIRYSKIAKSIEIHNIDNKYQLDALATAALVKYTRIFKSGVRERISNMEIGFNEEELDAHEYCINLRDKHISHSVNSYENCQVVAFLETEDNKKIKVSQIAAEPSRVMLTQQNIWAIGELAEKTKSYIDKLLTEQYEDILKKVSEMPQEYLKDLKEPEMFEIDHTAVGVARKSKHP